MDYISPFITWLSQSDYIRNNPLFLNALSAKNNNIQIVTQQIATADCIEYVDGSVLKTIIFTVFDYKSISFNQLVATMLNSNENIDKLLQVGNIPDFVVQMNTEGNFPAFGDGIEVQSILPANLTPSTPTIDSSSSPSLAKYSIPIVCKFIDYTNAIR